MVLRLFSVLSLEVVMKRKKQHQLQHLPQLKLSCHAVAINAHVINKKRRAVDLKRLLELPKKLLLKLPKNLMIRLKRETTKEKLRKL